MGRKKVKIMLDIFIKQTSKQFFIDHMRILFSQEKISYLKATIFHHHLNYITINTNSQTAVLTKPHGNISGE